MFRLAAAMILWTVALAQTAQEAEVAVAAKSPLTLARYVESHNVFDWDALWKALGARDADLKLTPCGWARDNPCSAEIATVLNPDQAVVIIRGSGGPLTVIYVRYLQEESGDWRFAGARRAYIKEYPSRHEILRFGGKPFLMISSDHSQIGVGFMQEVEDWFDLTQPDFEPVFSFTAHGSETRFGFGVGRTIHSQSIFSQRSGFDSIELILNVQFTGPSLNLPSTYVGVYDRPANEKKFTLLSAYSDLDRRTAIPKEDFEDLTAFFEDGPSNEKMLVYALPGLQKIATGSDPEARQWLQSVLSFAKDTPEKRSPLDLLTKPSAPAPPALPKPR